MIRTAWLLRSEDRATNSVFAFRKMIDFVRGDEITL